MAVPLAPLIARLEALLPAFSRPAAGPAPVNASMDVIQEVHMALQFAAPSGAAAAERRAAERLLGAAVDKLVALGATLRSPSSRSLNQLPAVGMQLCAAAGLMSILARLVYCTQLGAPAVQRLASALVLITGPSRLALVSALAAVRRSGPADHAALRFLAVLTGSQVEGVNDVLQSALDLPDSRQVLQQMEQCLSPVEFSRWLSALTDALLTIGDASAIGSLGPEAHPHERVDLARYADTCRLVMLRDGHSGRAPLPALQAAVESDAALCAKAAQLLLEQVLPAAARQTGLLPLPGGAALPPGRPSRGDWRFLTCTVTLLAQPGCLEEPRNRYHDDHDQQMMALAIDLVAGMPAACPPGQLPLSHWICWMWLGGLLAQGREALALCECCRRGSGRAANEEEVAALAWRLIELVPKMAAVTREAAAVAEMDGSSGVTDDTSAGAAGSSGGAPHQQQQEQQQGDSRSDFNHTVVQTLCLGWAQALQLLSSAGAARSVQHVAAFCAAADAGLRLLPLIMERHADMQQTTAARGSSSRGGASGSGARRHRGGHGRHGRHGAHSNESGGSVALRGGTIPEEDSFSGLAEVLVVRVFGDLAHRMQAYMIGQTERGMRPPPAVLALLPRVHQLAATMPRLLFWAAGPVQAVPGLPAVLVKWQWLVQPASNVLRMLYALVQHQGEIHTDQGDEDASEKLYRSLVPMLAAFGQAMLLVAPHLTGEGALTDRVHTQLLLLPFIINASLAMAHHSPTRLTSQLGPALHASLVQLAATPPADAATLALSIMRSAASSPQFSAELIRCGSVPLLLGLLAAGMQGLPEQQAMRQLKAFLACVLAMLQQMLSAAQTLLAIYGGSSSTAGEDAAGSSTEADSSVGGGVGGNRGTAGTVNASGNSGGGVSPAIVRQLRVAQVAAAAALLAVRSMLQNLERATGGVPHQMAQDVQHVWTEGGVQYEIGQLAAALQAAWAEPAPMAHEDVEAAEMAAGSSCAYLRCFNLGGEGGLAAGQGVGSKRCSGCRAVWYCGTACSHADWRQGGHKHTCKVLAALRQQAKEQRAAERQS